MTLRLTKCTGTIAIAIAIALAVPAAPASAADTVVATVEKATTIDAYGGRTVWSAWDSAARAYRLTVYRAGQVRTLPVAPNAVPFDVDLGQGPNGGTIAVYSRCRRPPLDTFALDGRRGCDLYAYRFTTRRETKLVHASSTADEYWPTVWRNRIAFTRTYKPRPHVGPRAMYWRTLTGQGRSHRLRGGPTGSEDDAADQLDLRGSRLAFVWQYEWGAHLGVSTLGGRARLLVRVPGSGAAANDLRAQGPTFDGNGAVYWGLSVGHDAPVYTELRRADLATHDQQRATTRVDADPARNRATSGVAQDSGTSWYVRAAAADAFEIHMATGLAYEPAPPIKLD